MLHERLGIIDNAHKNLTDLTSQVTTLRDVLANKQSRGAFGQARMEAIVQDGMPKGAYEFQFTLSTGKRPDCVVFLPDQRPLCIDAKFPLEAMTALHDARTDEEKKFATQRLRADVMKHVSDIAEKYLIPGETQDTALMFVPSESVYAEIHDGFDDVIQKAYRARVVLVSPSLLMLAIQVMQQILKDARMRDAADQIRTEVLNLGDDLGRLRDRVLKLQKHFGDANEDVRQILISADKIEKRAGRIEELDFSKDRRPRRSAAPRQAGRARAVSAAAQAAGGGVASAVMRRPERFFPLRGNLGPMDRPMPGLVQPRAAKALQIMLPIGLMHDGHLVRRSRRAKYWVAPGEVPARRPRRHRPCRPCRRRPSAPDGRRRSRRGAGCLRAPAEWPRRSCARRTARRPRCRKTPPKTDRAGSAATRGARPRIASSQRPA